MDKKSLILLILLMPSICFGGQVTLAWDFVDNADGYKIFARTEGSAYNYDEPSWKGPSTFCTIYNLTDNTNYCFVARAYNRSDESGDSNEVCTLVGSKVTPGKATGIRLSDD